MKKILFGLTLMSSLLLVGCLGTPTKEVAASVNGSLNILDLQDTKIHMIAVGDVDELLKREDIGIIDARTKVEFDEGTLDKRAILVEIKKGDELEGSLETFKREINKLNKDKTWLIYCGSGIRSDKGAETMVENGFKDVYELKGGLGEYKNQIKF